MLNIDDFGRRTSAPVVTVRGPRFRCYEPPVPTCTCVRDGHRPPVCDGCAVTDPPPLTDQEKLALLRRFEPVIRFTEGELFLPASAEEYVGACELWERRPAGGPVPLAVSGELDLDAAGGASGRATAGPVCTSAWSPDRSPGERCSPGAAGPTGPGSTVAAAWPRWAC
jgi:hypothetical protein